MNDISAQRPVKYFVCVDEREESRVAVKFASAKARRTGGSITLLHILTPPDFQTLQSVKERMMEESRQEAEALMQRLAGEVMQSGGPMPDVVLRHGEIGDEILAAVAEDLDVGLVVVGVAESGGGRGRLVSFLATQLGGKLLVPLLLVPGNLTDRQLTALI